MMLVCFKERGRWGVERSFANVTVADLELWRAMVQDAYKRTTSSPIGFAPRSFAASVVSSQGVKLPPGLNGILLSYALFQPVRVRDDDSGAWKTLRPVYEATT